MLSESLFSKFVNERFRRRLLSSIFSMVKRLSSEISIFFQLANLNISFEATSTIQDVPARVKQLVWEKCESDFFHHSPGRLYAGCWTE